MKTRMLVCVLVIFVFGISMQYGIADDFDWPRWRGPNGDGISMEMDWNPEALAGGPKILWKADVGMGYSNVAIKDNRLYTMGVGEKSNENGLFSGHKKRARETIPSPRRRRAVFSYAAWALLQVMRISHGCLTRCRADAKYFKTFYW